MNAGWKLKTVVIMVCALVAVTAVLYITMRPHRYNVPAAAADHFAQHGWAVAGEAIESKDQLPPDFLLNSGHFPWRVYLDLSADSGLDFSHLPGLQVKTFRFPVSDTSGADRLNAIREKYLLWGMALLDQDGKLVGAWLTYTDKNGEFERGIPGYSLQGKDLGQVTGLTWPDYAEKYSPANQVPAGFHPFGTHSGRPVVDRVIEALVRGDGTALAGMIKLSTATCAEPYQEDLGAVPCPEGTPNGTRLEVFPFSACQPNAWDAQHAAEAVRGRFGERQYLYAVYQTDMGYEVIVGSGKGDRGSSLHLDTLGSIVEVVNCGSPQNMVPGPNQHFTALLPPIR